jgi:hypothetical protein
MKNTLEMASCDMIYYISSFMPIGSGMRILLRLLPKEYERFQCWYY